MKTKKQTLTPAERKAFGPWLGFYNHCTSSTWTTKSALSNPKMLKLFRKMQDVSLKTASLSTIKKTMSTKKESFENLDLCQVDSTILHFLNKNPDISRSEIARKSKIKKIQTVTGACHRLIQFGLIEVIGSTIDSETNQRVQLLRSTGRSQ